MEERYCKICSLSEVEDEYHLLYSCPALQTERSQFYVNHIDNIATFMLLDDAAKTFLLGEDMIIAMGTWIEVVLNKHRSLV